MQDSFKNRLWHAVVLLLWGLWWGGLSFYAIVVVPVGTEQIGSVDQGFYSQHALYLWLTAIEWLYGLTVPLTLLSTWQASEVKDSNSRSLSES